MIFHCRDDGKVLVHFAANGKYWCLQCKLFRTRREVAFIKGGKDEQGKTEQVRQVPGEIS